MSDMLSIGASGVRAYQTALTTVSENISNAGTAGYARRTADIKEVVAAGGINSGTATGLGVTLGGVTRAADAMRASDVRSASADLARTETSATWMSRIDSALSGNQLGDRLGDFFNAARTLAADPSALAPRAVVLESAASVANAFTATGEAMAGAMADLDTTAQAGVDQLNALAAGLAKVNTGLGRAAPGSSSAAALMDERDRLLESMSALTDVSASFDSAGRTTLRVGGTGGAVLVRGDTAGTVTYVRNDEGAASFAIHGNGDTQTMSPTGGMLAGVSEGAQRIANAMQDLETLAADFVSGVNDLQASGRDLSGNSGEAMFAAGDPATRVTLTLSDPRGIAAASVGGGVRDNGNLLALETLRTGAAYEGRLTNMTASNGAALSARQTVSAAQTTIRDNAVAARDETQGVSIDEEAVDLIRFQQAFQAAGRVIQVARETLQTMLDIR